MMDKLKPCPFCGGTAEIYVETNTFYHLRFVECNFCHARTGLATFEEEAAEAWNMRTEEEKMDKTKIEWCDATWNPVTGCYHNCGYCYARKMANRFGEKGCAYTVDGEHIKLFETAGGLIFETDRKLNTPYPFGFVPTLHNQKLDQPSKWKKPRTIFVCSMADLFGEWVPYTWIKQVFEACRKAPQHRYLFLTKNPLRYLELESLGALPKGDNYWYGASITDPDTDYFVSPDYNTFVSAEPLLKPFKIGIETRAKWVIIGAETGNRSDKVIPKKEWIDNICRAADQSGVPVFMKDSLVPIVGEENMRREFPWEVAP